MEQEEDLMKRTAQVTLTALANSNVCSRLPEDQRATDRQADEYITKYCKLLGLGNIIEDLCDFYCAEKKRIRGEREAEEMSYPHNYYTQR